MTLWQKKVATYGFHKKLLGIQLTVIYQSTRSLSKAHNKLLKHRSGAKSRASTGQPKRWFFCAFATQIIAQKPQHFVCRLAKR